MPKRSLKPCAYIGCGNLTRERYCEEHQNTLRKYYDSQRGNSTQRGYGSRWQRIRATVLAQEPLCRHCAERGEIVPAQEVDHIKPLARGGGNDRENLQSLCSRCHALKTVKEDGGFGNPTR